MTEEPIPDSEEPIEDVMDTPDEVVKPSPRMVPLEALEAERTKRQDLESQNRALQEFMLKSKQPSEETEDDDDDFITKAEMNRRLEKATFSQKREVLEEAFCQSRPDAVDLINQNLEQIIKNHPWLAQSIESSPNRYARAYEIVSTMMPKEKVAPSSKFSRPQDDAKRIVENSQKPGNPSSISKTSQSSNLDYMKSIQGKPEFREYRRKMLSGG